MPVRAGCGRSVKNNHGAEKGTPTQGFRPQQQQGGRDVRAVGEPDGQEPERVDFIMRGRGHQEVGERLGATGDFLWIENAFGQSGKEPQGTAFAHVTTRTKQGRAG